MMHTISYKILNRVNRLKIGWMLCVCFLLVDMPLQAQKDFMYSQSVELPDMLAWLKEWKKDCGFRIISINNEGKELNDYRVKKFKLHECFDAFISSCEVKLRKPDPAIFNLAMGVALAQPSQCVYFDDRPMFANAAQKMGIRAFHHTDFESTKKILEELKKEHQPKLK